MWGRHIWLWKQKCIWIQKCMYRHLGSLTAANWVSFDFNVSYSSCWGYSLINTLKFKKKIGCVEYHYSYTFVRCMRTCTTSTTEREFQFQTGAPTVVFLVVVTGSSLSLVLDTRKTEKLERNFPATWTPETHCKRDHWSVSPIRLLVTGQATWKAAAAACGGGGDGHSRPLATVCRLTFPH